MNQDKKLQRLLKILPEVFVEESKTLSSDELKKSILVAAVMTEEVEDQKKADKELNDLKERVKLINEGYRDVIRVQKAKIQYSLQLLKDRGAE